MIRPLLRQYCFAVTCVPFVFGIFSRPFCHFRTLASSFHLVLDLVLRFWFFIFFCWLTHIIVCSISKMVKIVTFLSGHYNTQFGYGWSCHFGSISDDLTDLLWWYWSACNSRIHCWIWSEIGQFYGTIVGNESGSISCLSSLCKVRGFTSLRTDSSVHEFFSLL